MSEWVLEAHDLCKSYREGSATLTVLSGIELRVSPGERIAIVGASGSGKSTLLHLLGGLDRPDRGTVLIRGRDAARMSERERGLLRNETMGFVYQLHHLLQEFSAIENVAIPLLLRRSTSILEVRQRTVDRLREVGLETRLEHRPSELSGGERQRVAIARALVTTPLLLLADEPTGNLDPHTGEGIYDLLLDMNARHGTALIVVTHEVTLAAKMHRRYRLNEGRLVPLEG
ncbi:lipoprotein transporter ATP-binding subunit [mine drainage metagenome]|uniref:Lipoprotein transporter ATP-binding subunit n=3 Tax=mine drainage metagenome TaxID=410659 RepID=T0ZZG2_9ZZZZ